MYTNYSVDVSLATTDSIQVLPGIDNKKLFPFDNIEIHIKETHICPFCRKELGDSLMCDCNEFEAQLKKLQETHQDSKHESELHYDMLYLVEPVYIEPIESMEPLENKEILELEPNIWDKATRATKSGYAYLIINGSYENNMVSFLFKDVQTQKIYRCTTNEINVQPKVIYLGTEQIKTVSDGDPKKLGNYHLENTWINIGIFLNWEQLCRILQAV